MVLPWPRIGNGRLRPNVVPALLPPPLGGGLPLGMTRLFWINLITNGKNNIQIMVFNTFLPCFHLNCRTICDSWVLFQFYQDASSCFASWKVSRGQGELEACGVTSTFHLHKHYACFHSPPIWNFAPPFTPLFTPPSFYQEHLPRALPLGWIKLPF